jgi:RNA polymerase sigma factor (sigma-70 family)
MCGQGREPRARGPPSDLRAVSSARKKQAPGLQHACTNAEAFWDTWENHHDYLFHLSLRWMRGNRADAEDALSSAQLKAAASFRCGPSGVRNEKAWLSRILHNACMDIYRGRRAATEVDFEDLEDLPDTNITARCTSPEEAVLKRELLHRFQEVLTMLPKHWRTAFIERCLLGSSYGDIAERAETTQANIRKRVQLARAFVRHHVTSAQQK